jgi:hypothetical protein
MFQIQNLGYSVRDFALQHLKEGGSLLFKISFGGQERTIKSELEKVFPDVKFTKPLASRQGSAERYILARDFLKPKVIPKPKSTTSEKPATPAAEPKKEKKKEKKAEPQRV